jgi:hypothetical protein
MKLSRLHNTSGTNKGQCHHGILVVVQPYITEAKALASGCLLVGSLCLLCCMLADAADKPRGLVE